MTTRRAPIGLAALLLSLVVPLEVGAQDQPTTTASTGSAESSAAASPPPETSTSPSASAAAPPAADGEESAAEASCECAEPGPRWTLYFGGLMGGGSTFDGANPYGYGLGLQVGITLGRPNFFFGISLPWYAGDDKAFQFTFDIGYDFRSGPAVLRPLIAIGADRWRLEQAMGPDLKQGAVLFEVGWHLHFDLGAHTYIGGEFRWAYTSHGGDDSSWHAWGVFGARFSG